jgi:hypothetical protein
MLSTLLDGGFGASADSFEHRDCGRRIKDIRTFLKAFVWAFYIMEWPSMPTPRFGTLAISRAPFRLKQVADYLQLQFMQHFAQISLRLTQTLKSRP